MREAFDIILTIIYKSNIEIHSNLFTTNLKYWGIYKSFVCVKIKNILEILIFLHEKETKQEIMPANICIESNIINYILATPMRITVDKLNLMNMFLYLSNPHI